MLPHTMRGIMATPYQIPKLNQRQLSRCDLGAENVAFVSGFDQPDMKRGMAGVGVNCHYRHRVGTAISVKGFGRLRTKPSNAGTRGPHALVYG